MAESTAKIEKTQCLEHDGWGGSGALDARPSGIFCKDHKATLLCQRSHRERRCACIGPIVLWIKHNVNLDVYEIRDLKTPKSVWISVTK